MRRALGLIAVTAAPVFAQVPTTIRVAEPAWLELAPPERDIISQRYLVNIFPANSAGIITDAQTINESTPGTTAGSQIGAAYGSAAYVDRAFRGPRYNYSAAGNVTAALAGAIIGGALDQPARAQFHTRYAIRMLDGQIQYRDEVKADAFRHSLGVCVSTSLMEPIDQTVCSQTAAVIRRLYLTEAGAAAPPPPPHGDLVQPEDRTSEAPVVADELVRCKFGSSAPVVIARAKCEMAQGEIR